MYGELALLQGMISEVTHLKEYSLPRNEIHNSTIHLSYDISNINIKYDVVSITVCK